MNAHFRFLKFVMENYCWQQVGQEWSDKSCRKIVTEAEIWEHWKKVRANQ